MSRLQQAFPVKPTNVEATALVGGGLLVEAVPVTVTYAAQVFHPSLIAEIIRQAHSRVSFPLIGCP
jgi:hypothetical protein